MRKQQRPTVKRNEATAADKAAWLDRYRKYEQGCRKAAELPPEPSPDLPPEELEKALADYEKALTNREKAFTKLHAMYVRLIDPEDPESIGACPMQSGPSTLDAILAEVAMMPRDPIVERVWWGWLEGDCQGPPPPTDDERLLKLIALLAYERQTDQQPLGAKQSNGSGQKKRRGRTPNPEIQKRNLGIIKAMKNGADNDAIADRFRIEADLVRKIRSEAEKHGKL